MTDLSLSLTLKALDKGATPTVRSFTAVVHGLSREVKKQPAGWTAVTTSMNKTTVATGKMSQATRTGGKALQDLIEKQRRLRAETDRTESAWSRWTRTVRKTPGGGAGGMGLLGLSAFGGPAAMAGTALAAAGGAAAYGVAKVGKGAINTGARFEGYQTQLTTVNDGDVGKARAEMGWVQKFAKQTPYDLDQVMTSFVRLKANGIDPMDGTLKSLGNTASGMGKDLLSAVEMLADAQTGEFERLKEFGVKAKVQGDKVTFTYRKNGKDIAVTSKKTAGEIQRTLVGIFDKRFAGGMEAQSKTFNGMLSNLGDGWVGFLKKIADKGLFEKAKGLLGGLLAFLDKAEKDGRLDKWAGEIATSLGSTLDSLSKIATSIDWVQLAKDVGTLAQAVGWLAENLGKLNKAPKSDMADKLKFLGPAGMMVRSGIAWGEQEQDKRKAAKPGAKPKPFPLFSTNPVADGIRAGRARAAAGGGGPPKPAPLKGDIKIGLAPGLTLQKSDFGPGVRTNRGPAGG